MVIIKRRLKPAATKNYFYFRPLFVIGRRVRIRNDFDLQDSKKRGETGWRDPKCAVKSLGLPKIFFVAGDHRPAIGSDRGIMALTRNNGKYKGKALTIQQAVNFWPGQTILIKISSKIN